jgi:hypothetical protein
MMSRLVAVSSRHDELDPPAIASSTCASSSMMARFAAKRSQRDGPVVVEAAWCHEAGQYALWRDRCGQRARDLADDWLDGEEELEHEIDETIPSASVWVLSHFHRLRNCAGSFHPHETIPFSLFINMGQ